VRVKGFATVRTVGGFPVLHSAWLSSYEAKHWAQRMEEAEGDPADVVPVWIEKREVD
jgi:hypothetical protein